MVDLDVNTGVGDYEIRSFGLTNSMSETLVSDGRRIQVKYKQTDEIKSGNRPIGFEAEYETMPLGKRILESVIYSVYIVICLDYQLAKVMIKRRRRGEVLEGVVMCMSMRLRRVQ